MSEYGFVAGGRLTDAHNVLLRNDQQMHRGLGLDVVDDDAMLILMLEARWDFFVYDFLEDGFHGLDTRL